MSDKRNIRDHKRSRLLAAKSELRRKLYKAFCKDPGFLVICGTNIVISCPSCQERVPLHESETNVFPRAALERSSF